MTRAELQDQAIEPASATRRRSSAGLGRTVLRLLVRLVLVIVVLAAVWQAVVSIFGVSSFVLPAPGDVLSDAQWSQVADATKSSIFRIIVGFTVGNLVGVLLALLSVASPFFSALLYPFALSFRSIPIIALAPFITLALGRGLLAIMLITTMLVFFPTYVNVSLGLRSVDRQLLELMRVLNCPTREVFYRVRFPAALPYLMSALRIAAPTAVLGVLIGEWVIGTNGLGKLILDDSINLDLPTMWGGVLVAAALSLFAFAGVGLVERRVLSWRHQSQ
jgi:NitT/TauT family transport system permease protein